VIIIVFGVSGAGKTTVGKLLAQDLGWRFVEADDFHPAANIEKMRSGHALTDEDRWPWLERLRQQIEQSVTPGENGVLACSALKRAYRNRLRVSDEVQFVFLSGDYALIEKQLRRRHRHFMNPDLLQGQFDDLEQPQPEENVLTIKLGGKPEEIVDRIKTKLILKGESIAESPDSIDEIRRNAGDPIPLKVIETLPIYWGAGCTDDRSRLRKYDSSERGNFRTRSGRPIASVVLPKIVSANAHTNRQRHPPACQSWRRPVQ
jgi:gluconokinase